MRLNYQTAQEIKKNAEMPKTKYFSLADDGAIGHIHILANSLEDLCIVKVHKVSIDGKFRYINCLRDTQDPVSACPICARMPELKPQYRVLLQVYDADTKEVKLWDRGLNFISKLEGYVRRLGGKPLYSVCFEVERHGRKGDMKTTYELFPLANDPVYPELATMEGLPILNDLISPNGFVMDKTFDELNNYVDNTTDAKSEYAPRPTYTPRPVAPTEAKPVYTPQQQAPVESVAPTRQEQSVTTNYTRARRY